MLELLRKASKTWVAKALLILLVGSFGVWGVHASMFGGVGSAVVQVGDQKVSNNEFRIAFNSAVNRLSQQFGTQLTFEQAKMFGVENQVIGQLVSQAALDQLTADMKLGLSQDRILTLIQQEPAFHDPSTGAFNREIMVEQLRRAGIRPEDYLDSVTQQAVRTQIADALTGGFAPPSVLVDTIKAYGAETRSIDYILLTNANIDPVKAPAEDVLAKWYEANKAKYRAPEYRKFTYVRLEPVDIADTSAISDEAVKEDYEKHLDKYRSPETRTIEQLTFANKADADAAAAKLAAGTTFEQLISEQGKTATDVLLGDFTKDKMPTPKMADAAFAVTADGAVTPVTDGMLGPVILRVSNIRKETVKSLDKVKDEIRKDLALVLANDEIQNVYDRFEDARASGASLAEVAKQLQLKAVIVDASDAEGKDTTGAEVKDLPSKDKLLGEVFKTEAGVETLPLNVENGGYVWFELNGVTPERDRKIEEVKDTVVADWTKEQQKQALSKKADEVMAKLKAGTKLTDIATGLGVAVESKTGIRRSTSDAILSADAIRAAFGGPEGYAASEADTSGDNRIVLQVTSVNPDAQLDALDNNDAQVQQLAASAGDEILNQTVGELQGEYGVSVDRALAAQLMVAR